VGRSVGSSVTIVGAAVVATTVGLGDTGGVVGLPV